jgi:hypothetical protein
MEIDRVVLVANPSVPLLNRDFESDSTVADYRYMTPYGWICALLSKATQPSNCAVVKSTSNVWGGGSAPSGNFYVVLQGTKLLQQEIEIRAQSSIFVLLFARSRPSFPLTGMSVSVGKDIIYQNLTTNWALYSLDFSTVYSTKVKVFLSITTSKQICNPYSADCSIEIDNIYISADDLYSGSTSQIPCPFGQYCPMAGLTYSMDCSLLYSGLDCFDSGTKYSFISMF